MSKEFAQKALNLIFMEALVCLVISKATFEALLIVIVTGMLIISVIVTGMLIVSVLFLPL